MTLRERLTYVGLAFLAVIVFVLAHYGPVTQVAFKTENGIVYREILNGPVGANCFDEQGNKVIAPSRWFGPQWTPVASANDPASQSMSITCHGYFYGTQSASVQGDAS